jgi:hypothetical protein
LTVVAAYRLVGYDRTTAFQEASYAVPPNKLSVVKKVAGLKAADAALMGDWPLADATARQIARLIGQEIDLARMEFFLEPSAVPVQHVRDGT